MIYLYATHEKCEMILLLMIRGSSITHIPYGGI